MQDHSRDNHYQYIVFVSSSLHRPAQSPGSKCSHSCVSLPGTLGSQSRRLRSTAQSLIFSKLRQVCVVRMLILHFPSGAFQRQKDAPRFVSHIVAWRMRSTQWSYHSVRTNLTGPGQGASLAVRTYHDGWICYDSSFHWERIHYSLGISLDITTSAKHSRMKG